MRERKRIDRSNPVKPSSVKPTVSALQQVINNIEDAVSPSVEREASSTVKPMSNPKRKKYYELTPEEKGVTSYDGDGYPIYEE